MALPWFRFYYEWDSDPKVQIMPEPMQRRLVMLFCHRCKSDVSVTFRETEIAFHWRVSMAELAETKALFLQQGFIDEQWNLIHWDQRQFLSDSSTERVKRYRKRVETSQKRYRNVTATNCNGDVTGQDTDTDTEQTNKKTKAAPPKAPLFVLPDWISCEVWKDFEEMRRKIKAPLTDKARKNIVAELVRIEATGQHAEDVLNQSITNSWRGVFPIKTDGGSNGRGGGSYGNRGQARTNGNLEAARSAAEAIAGQGSDWAGGGPASVRERGDVEAVQRASV